MRCLGLVVAVMAASAFLPALKCSLCSANAEVPVFVLKSGAPDSQGTCCRSSKEVLVVASQILAALQAGEAQALVVEALLAILAAN